MGGERMSFDPVSYAMGQQTGKGGGGVTVEPLSVSENGVYTAPSGKAYSPVEVDLPGPGWSEFTVAMNTTTSDESFGVLFHDTQEGKTYVAIINKDKKDYVNNQLLQCIARNTGAVVTNWIGAYVRNRANNVAMANISAAYDAVMQAGDKYLISEVDGG